MAIHTLDWRYWLVGRGVLVSRVPIVLAVDFVISPHLPMFPVVISDMGG